MKVFSLQSGFLRTLSCLLAVFLAGACGKRDRQKQFDLEGLTAATLQKFLTLSENRPDHESITNVAQIFAIMDLSNAHRTHPYVLQDKFQAFGPNAGFKNSIYEKYVVFSPGLTNEMLKGPIIVMSSLPFLDLDGHPVRMVVWKAGQKDYRQITIQEDRVQQMFHELGQAIPVALPMPPATPPPDVGNTGSPPQQKVELFFRDIAGDIGIGRGRWWLLILVLGIGVVLVGAISILLFTRRRG